MGLGWIAPAIQGAVAIGEFAYGLNQKRKGKDMLEDLDRPEYEIPEGILENLSAAERYQLEGLPAEQKRAVIEEIEKNTQEGFAQLNKRNLGVAGVAALNRESQDSYRQLMVDDAIARKENRGDVAEAKTTLASYEDQQWQVNDYQPYEQTYLEAQALVGSGTQNIMGGLSSFGEAAGNLAGTDLSSDPAKQAARHERRLERIKARNA